MDWIADWIWDRSDEYEKNVWLCFRKAFVARGVASAQLSISADARYTVSIDGNPVGRGPGRYWPFSIEVDPYEVTRFLQDGEHVLAVEVNHYGTSTSQYIHQPGGLFAQLDLELVSGERQTICSGETFRCLRCDAFLQNTSRVNVSQPYVEAYDARKMDERWKRPGFDDGNWPLCVPAQDAAQKKAAMTPRDIPSLAERRTYPRAVLRKRWTQPRGTGVTVDFGRAFYPNDTSTADKLQIGYLATSIHSDEERTCRFTLASKMWPFKPERFSVNGVVTVLDADQRSSEIRLRKGENLFLLDVSGAYQRYYIDLQFDCEGISFRVEEYHCRFVGIGPFDHAVIGNIVCAEGFHVNWDDPRYQAAIHARSFEELRPYRALIRPIDETDIDDDNIKTKACFQSVIQRHAVWTEDQHMAVPNGACSVVLPSLYDTEYLVDFGTEVSGFVSIDLEAAAGTTVDLLGFEYLGDAPEIPDDLNNSMRYIAGGGRAGYTFHRRAGFRYLLLTVRASAAPSRIYEVSVLESNYPAAQAGSFRCSDETLNSIWQISKNALRLCMEDVFVDCPAFEQAYWIGDAYLTALYQFYVYGNAEIAKRSLRMAGQSLRRSRLPECHVPAGVSFVLSTWSLLWALAASEYYQYTGDLDFEREIYPAVRQTLDEFLRFRNTDGLLEIDAWNMLDWSGMDTPYHGVVTHLNGFLVRVLRAAADMARRAGDTETAERYPLQADGISRAINAHLWDDARQAYVDCARDGAKSGVVSLLTQAVLWLCGCVPEDRKPAVLRLLDDEPAYAVGFGTPFACFFLYEVLASRGRFDELIDDIRRRWSVMLAHGATTCWETFIGFYQERLTRSYCHAWSAVPCYMFGRYVLGVVPTAPGFSRIRIEPHGCGLRAAEGAVPTPRGIIFVSWSMVNGEIALRYEVPEGITVEVE